MPSRPGKRKKTPLPARKRAAAAGKPTGPRPPKRRPQPAAEPRQDGRERLQKVLAAAGLASRRECETLIEEGRVEVDGQVVTELGVRVDPFEQTIHVDGEQLRQPKRVYFAVNKPEGVVCTARDPDGRPRVTDLLPPDFGRVFAVGRLDLASEGLILVTNDGELANQLTHPRHGVRKTYHVQVAGHPTAETLRELRGGIRLAEGKAHFLEARIKSRRKKSTILEVMLDEGRNREIRRLLARVEHKVQRLTRVAVGPVRLGDMPPGAYRPLTREEVKKLREAVDAPPPPATATSPRAKPARKPSRPKKAAAGSVPLASATQRRRPAKAKRKP